MLRRIFFIILFVLMVWGLLVFALPGVVLYLPSWCARWELVDGVCGNRVQDRLQSTDEWIKTYLNPFAEKDRYDPLLARAYAGLSIVRTQVELQDDDGKVKAAMSHIDRSLAVIGERLEQQHVLEKVEDVPHNAGEMLANASEAADRLRSVVGETERKAEDVRNAAQNMQHALDALSNALTIFSRFQDSQQENQ